MKYEIEEWNNRTVFIFKNHIKTFQEFTEIIDKLIQPDHKSEVEITSWTEAFIFKKDEIEIYFQNFYGDDSWFSFELYPFEKQNKSDLKKLKNLMDQLSSYSF